MNDQDKIAELTAEIDRLGLVLAERQAKIGQLMGEAAKAALPVGIVARDLMPKRSAFIAWCERRGLETVEDRDAWGKRKFKHSHIEALWEGWFNAPDGAPQPTETAPAAFKNFHRALCDRFNYTHDGKFWWRDQVSLIEHIAASVPQLAVPNGFALVPLEPTNAMTDAMESCSDDWPRTTWKAAWSAAIPSPQAPDTTEPSSGFTKEQRAAIHAKALKFADEDFQIGPLLPAAPAPTKQQDELPITRSTYGSLEACEAEQARRNAAPTEQAGELPLPEESEFLLFVRKTYGEQASNYLGATPDRDDDAVAKMRMGWVGRAALAARQAPDSRDAERLDWLEKNCTGGSDSERYLPFRIYWGNKGATKGLRFVLDAAIDKEKAQ